MKLILSKLGTFFRVKTQVISMITILVSTTIFSMKTWKILMKICIWKDFRELVDKLALIIDSVI